jgi:putative ABC transport system ATP-binding protein
VDKTPIAAASPATVRADRGALGTRIDLDDVAKRFRIGDVTVTALEEVNLHVDEAALVVMLGPSGSGKTTLLNLIGALDTPTEGRIRVGGVDITTASRSERFRVRRETVSFVFQSFNLFPGLTALENVEFGTEVAGRRDDGIAASVLEQVGLVDRANHFPHQLSGGEQQRVALARAFMARPPILLADEPTGNLDSQNGQHVLELLITLNKREGATLVLVTHDELLASHAGRRIVLRDGLVVSDEVRVRSTG